MAAELTASASATLQVNCSVKQITTQLKNLPQTMTTCELLHRLETERSKMRKVPYRVGVRTLVNRLKRRVHKNRKIKNAVETRVTKCVAVRGGRTRV